MYLASIQQKSKAPHSAYLGSATLELLLQPSLHLSWLSHSVGNEQHRFTLCASIIIAAVFYFLTEEGPVHNNLKASGAAHISLKNQIEPLRNWQAWRFATYYFLYSEASSREQAGCRDITSALRTGFDNRGYSGNCICDACIHLPSAGRLAVRQMGRTSSGCISLSSFLLYVCLFSVIRTLTTS